MISTTESVIEPPTKTPGSPAKVPAKQPDTSPSPGSATQTDESVRKSTHRPNAESIATSPTLSPELSADPRIVAVIPAYNEELVIGTVVLRSLEYAGTVIVVDDGSTDRTTEVAKLAGAKVITLPRNRGKAYALLEGFAQARRLAPLPEAFVMLDGDGQHDPAEIPAVAEPVLEGKADLVIGSRFIANGNGVKNGNGNGNGNGHRIPIYRQTGQTVLNVFTNLAVEGGTKVTDSQSGFRALSRNAMEHMDFAADGYSVESGMISHFGGDGFVIAEVPIGVRYDVPHKHKKNPVSHGFGVLGSLVGLIGYKRPLLTFGVTGVLLAGAGIFAAIYTLSVLYTEGVFHYMIFFLSIVGMIMGLLLVTTGLILNSLVLIMKETSNYK